MRKYLLSFILLAISHVGYSQLSVGVAGGYTNNTLDADAGYYEREYLSMDGYSVAIPIQYSFNNWFALRTEVGYMTKSYRWDRGYIEDVYEYQIVAEYGEHRNGYLSLPVMANFGYGGERWRAFVNVGAWVGAWLDGRVRTDALDVFNYQLNYADNRYEFDSQRDNRFDAGLLCGIGAEYRVCEQIGLFVEGRYMYGVTDMQKSYRESYPRYNTTILVQLGVMYSFNLK
ncbi:MAG: porin family protein [Rikenellaceae bacterium]